MCQDAGSDLYDLLAIASSDFSKILFLEALNFFCLEALSFVSYFGDFLRNFNWIRSYMFPFTVFNFHLHCECTIPYLVHMSVLVCLIGSIFLDSSLQMQSVSFLVQVAIFLAYLCFLEHNACQNYGFFSSETFILYAIIS